MNDNPDCRPNRTYIEDLSAPEFFVTGAEAFVPEAGIVAVTLSTSRLDKSAVVGERKQVTVARVVLPFGVARALASGLLAMVSAEQQVPSQPSAKPDQLQ